MSLIVYPALVTETPDGVIGVFPDFAGLTVSATSPADLLLACRQRLSQRLDELEKAGEVWPEPSTLTQVRARHPGDETSIVLIDLTVEETPIRVTISIGDRLLAQIDAAAATYALTRSGFLAACARRQITLGASPLASDSAQRLYEDVAAAGRKIHETLGPDSAVGRTLADLDAMAVDGLRRIAEGVSTAVRRPTKSSRAAQVDAESKEA